MSNLYEILTFKVENVYDCAYDFPMKKNYSNPKLYTANGDLKKRWYVYYHFLNPKTGRLKCITPFNGDANKYKTKEDRLFVLSACRKKILELLKKGYNPFEDNCELYRKQKELEKLKVLLVRFFGSTPFIRVGSGLHFLSLFILVLLKTPLKSCF